MGKPYRKILLVLCSIAGILISAHLLLPQLVNTGAVRTKILAQLSGVLPGEVSFDRLTPALLPVPKIEIIQGGFAGDTAQLVFSRGQLRPKLLALLSGRFEIAALTLVEPTMTITLAAESGKADDPMPMPDALGWQQQMVSVLGDIYTVMGSDAAMAIGGGRLNLRRNDAPLLTLSDLDLWLHADQGKLRLSLETQSSIAKRIELQAHARLDAPNAGGLEIDVTGFNTEALMASGLGPSLSGLPVLQANGRLVFQTEDLETFAGQFSAATPAATFTRNARQWTATALMVQGTFRWTPERLQVDVTQFRSAAPRIEANAALEWPLARDLHKPIQLTARGTDIELAQIRTGLRQLAGDLEGVQTATEIVLGGVVSSIAVHIAAPDWNGMAMVGNLEINGQVSGGRIVLPNDLLRLQNVTGNVIFKKGRLLGENLSAQLGNTVARQGKLTLDLVGAADAFSLETELDLELAELPSLLNQLVDDADTQSRLQQLPPLAGRATGRLRLGDSLNRIHVGLEMAGTVHLLDSAMELSITSKNLVSSAADLTVAGNGQIGTQSLEWLGKSQWVSADLLPKSALAVHGFNLSRGPSDQLLVQADVAVARGPEVSTALRLHADIIQCEKLHIKDSVSDASLSFRGHPATGIWDVRYKGVLHQSTLAAITSKHPVLSGAISGSGQIHLESQTPGRSTINGTLNAKGLGVSSPSLGEVQIDSAELVGAGKDIKLPQAVLQWRDLRAALSGSAKIQDDHLDVDLALTADVLDLDAVIKALDDDSASEGAGAPSASDKRFSVKGKLSVDTTALTYGGYRFSPLRAAIQMARPTTTVEVVSTNLCGIDATGRITLRPDIVQIAVKPRAQNSALHYTSGCLQDVDTTERLEGVMDLSGDITTEGASISDLIRNLNGKIDLRIADGRVYNIGAAGFFTNLLSYISLNQLIQGDMPDIRKNDFQYQSISSQIALKDGLVLVEAGVLKSSSVNLVTEGSYNLAADDMKLDLLISPLTTLDHIVERIPIVGNILQGTLVAVPARVRGPLANPQIVPLSPAAVGSRVDGILRRTLNTPFRLIEPIIPKQEESTQEAR